MLDDINYELGCFYDVIMMSDTNNQLLMRHDDR